MNKFKFIRWIKEIIFLYKNPFIYPVIYFYFGKIKKGTPYFLPRKWVKYNKKQIIAYVEEEYEKRRILRKYHEINGYTYSDDYYNYNDIYKSVKNSKFAKSVKWLYINLIFHGWKTKWTSIDYRHEWNPGLSLVILNKQLCIEFKANPKITSNSFYFENLLYYKYNTSGKIKNRIKQMTDVHFTKDSLNVILKKKYRKL